MLETQRDGETMIREELQHLAIDIDQIHEHPQNVRQGDIGAISESLKAHGQYRPIVYQQSTGRILAGNHTWKAAKALGWKRIAATPVICDDEQAIRILLVDNKTNDLSTYDQSELTELLKELSATDLELLGTGYDGDDLDTLIRDLEHSLNQEQEIVNPYSQIIKIPQYEIVGDQPPATALVDTTKANQLIDNLDKVEMPSEVRQFLEIAATRHYVFNYSKIAEFYPHMTPEVQRLMEQSVLVIIDVDDAIANGYATFDSTIASIRDEDNAS